MILYIMFHSNVILVILYFSGYCVSENMNRYKLLSNTPITKYCPDDAQHIYKIYEKHPNLPEIIICCATRISYKFMLTEKICLKKMDPKYITAQSCNKKIVYQAQALFTPDFENRINGVLLIQVNEISGTEFNQTTFGNYSFFSEYNNFDWEKKNCTIYGTSMLSNKKEMKYYTKWTTISNNTIIIYKHCQHNIQHRHWLCPENNYVQFCEEDIGCPMICDNKILGIASIRYNTKIWATNMDCGNIDVETRYLYLNWDYVKWIKETIK